MGYFHLQDLRIFPIERNRHRALPLTRPGIALAINKSDFVTNLAVTISDFIPKEITRTGDMIADCRLVALASLPHVVLDDGLPAVKAMLIAKSIEVPPRHMTLRLGRRLIVTESAVDNGDPCMLIGLVGVDEFHSNYIRS